MQSLVKECSQGNHCCYLHQTHALIVLTHLNSHALTPISHLHLNSHALKPKSHLHLNSHALTPRCWALPPPHRSQGPIPNTHHRCPSLHKANKGALRSSRKHCTPAQCSTRHSQQRADHHSKDHATRYSWTCDCLLTERLEGNLQTRSHSQKRLPCNHHHHHR